MQEDTMKLYQPTMKQIVIIGSSNTDMVIHSDHLPKPGETVLGGNFMMNHGGKGANQAVAVARLGAPCCFIARVGCDVFGHETIEMLRTAGIDISHVYPTPGYSSGVALINVDHKGENSISVASGANAVLSPVDIDSAEQHIANASMILMQLETPIPTVVHTAQIAKRHGVKVVLNPAPVPAQPLPAELLANVDILIPNKTEAEIISGIRIESEADEIKAVRSIKAMGVGSVIITLGSKGALICDDDECDLIPAFSVSPVDTTAAGDTFCGALCVALNEGLGKHDAINFANKAAAISVTRPGAQKSIPTRSELDTYIFD